MLIFMYVLLQLEHGTKSNGSAFAKFELENIRSRMVEAREKVNLRISDLALMFGICGKLSLFQIVT